MFEELSRSESELINFQLVHDLWMIYDSNGVLLKPNEPIQFETFVLWYPTKSHNNDLHEIKLRRSNIYNTFTTANAIQSNKPLQSVLE